MIYSQSDGLSADCLHYYMELVNVSSLDSCENVACSYGFEVYEYNGANCRFYDCSTTELSTFPTTNRWGSFDVYRQRT